MDPLELITLTALMKRTSGSPDVMIGLIDGPVVTQHPDLPGEHVREIPACWVGYRQPTYGALCASM